MSQAVEDLKVARAILADLGRWTQGTSARDEWGVPVAQDSPRAVSFCAIGALSRAAPEEGRYFNAKLFLNAYIHEQYQGMVDGIVHVNDDLGHEAVLDMFDNAIALAEAAP